MDSTAPLTHHEIMALAAPFVRRGHQPDLAASDRVARRLHFKPRPTPDGRVETLVLEPAAGGRGAPAWQLTRHSAPTGHDGAPPLQARLDAQGDDLAALLDRIEAVPVPEQWLDVAGVAVALSHRLPPATAGRPDPAPQLTEARALFNAAPGGTGPALALALKVPRVHSMPGELTLQPAPGQRLAAPEDLLAVLGLAWSRLAWVRGAWRGTVELKRREPARSADALARLQRGVAHLAQTLAAPPAQFHARHQAARWRVTLRRATPALVALGLIVLSAAVPVLGIGEGSVLRMLVFNAPPLLMVWFFSLREMPRIEVPPLPRPLAARAWIDSAPQG